MRVIVKDSTDQEVRIKIIDSVTGVPEQAVEHNTTGIALWYRRPGAARTTITPAALASLTTAHTDGGIEHIDDGVYRLDVADAAFATGVDSVYIGGTVTDMIVLGVDVQLVEAEPDVNVQKWKDTTVATPTVAGIPQVELSSGSLDDVAGLGAAHSGTAQAGASTSITLAAGASATDDIYNDAIVEITSGTGAGQAQRITAYNGTTKVATVEETWITTPDNTSVYDVYPDAAPASGGGGASATDVRSVANGTADSGTTTTLVDAARTEADTDYWVGCVLLITSGTISGQTRRITAFTPGTDTITVDTAFTQAVGTNTYEILATTYAEAPAAGSGDWTTAEKNQMRYRLQLDGTTAAPAADAPTQLPVDVGAVSGDTTAADNLELMYDGTGYTDSTGPASRAQVSGIGAASGGSLNFEAAEDNVLGAIKSITFDGVQTSGTFASTEADDGTYHNVTHSANNIDIVYGYDVGGARTSVEVVFKGYLNGSNDEATIQAYDFVGAGWDTVRTLSGQNGTTNVTETVALLSKHTGTGADLGKVYIRIECAAQTSPDLFVDQILVEAVSSNTSIGYEGGAVWIDTAASNTNTESFVDGTADNPVSTLAAATTIAGNLNLKMIHVLPGSSITLAQSYDSYEFTGRQYTIALGSQSIANSYIVGATISGTFSGTNPLFEDCIINAITGPGVTMRRCFFNDVTMTNNGTNGWFLNDCRSRVAGTGSPGFDFGVGVGNTALNVRDYSGGLEIENMGDTGADTASIEGVGQVIFNANCDGGTAAVRGVFKISDNSSGNVEVVRQDPTFDQVDQGRAQGGSANTITLAATASATNGQYDPGTVLVVAGAGSGQARNILEYNGTTKVAVVDKDWRTNPDTSSSYVVTTQSGALHVNEGLAQGGASTTITLNTSGSATDNIYNGQTVFLVAGTGQDQARIVTAYNGTTKVATVHRAWNTNPDATTSYVMLPLPVIGDSVVNIEADTNELQGDWADGGRLDLLLDAIPTTPMRGTDSAATAANLAIVDANVDAIKLKTDNLPEGIVKNAAFSNIEFLMVLTGDGRTPATGLTVTGTRSIDGGAFSAVSGTIAEVSNGIYSFDALAADTNGDSITYRFTAATADDRFLTIYTTA